VDRPGHVPEDDAARHPVRRAQRARRQLPAGHAEGDHQERYLRDFFAGHFGVTDATFVAAELTNSLVDPRLAELSEAHHRSHADALAEIDRLTEIDRLAAPAGSDGLARTADTAAAS
jgi:hypothetical protein